MEKQKLFEFHGTPGGYFVVFFVTVLLQWIPFLGWAFVLNYTSSWTADNALVNGRRIKYEATFGETLGFVFVNTLLVIITLGIYTFWFVPKTYRYIADHTRYADVPAPV